MSEDFYAALAEIPRDIRMLLKRTDFMLHGRLNALTFIFEQGGSDLTVLREQIRDTARRISNPPESLKGPMQPNAGPRMVEDGYLAGLQDALQLMEKAEVVTFEEFEQRVVPTLQRETWLIQGSADAFDFAITSRADSDQLQQQVRETEERLVTIPPEQAEILLEGKPRWYYEGYLKGLQDALKIIQQGTTGQDTT